jgi:hypothetical protein
MDSQPDMFAASQEACSLDGGEVSFGIDRQDSDCSWVPGSTPASSQSQNCMNKDQLFLVSLAAIQSLFT